MTAIQIYGLLCFTVVLHIHTTISVVKVKRNAAELSSDTHRIELSRVPASSVGRNGVRLFGVSEQFAKYTEWVNYVHFLDIKGQNTRTFHLHAWFRSRPDQGLCCGVDTAGNSVLRPPPRTFRARYTLQFRHLSSPTFTTAQS